MARRTKTVLAILAATTYVAVLASATITDEVTTASTAWRATEAGSTGQYFMLSVMRQQYPKALAAVAPPKFGVQATREMPDHGAGEDADARLARATAEDLAQVAAATWQRANRSEPAHDSATAHGMAGVAGPSAGLVLTLAAIDHVVPQDLSAGLKVAATGTIDTWGTVGAIGAVDLKARAAVHAGADVMFVPMENIHELDGTVKGTEIQTMGAYEGAARTSMYYALGSTWASARRYTGPTSTAVVPVATVFDAMLWLCGAGDNTEVCRTAVYMQRGLARLYAETYRPIVERENLIDNLVGTTLR